MLRLLRAPIVDDCNCTLKIADQMTADGGGILVFYCAGRRMHFKDKAILELADLANDSIRRRSPAHFHSGEIDTMPEVGIPASTMLPWSASNARRPGRSSHDRGPPCNRSRNERRPRYAVIWLHGLGADGSDFEPVIPTRSGRHAGHPLCFSARARNAGHLQWWLHHAGLVRHHLARTGEPPHRRGWHRPLAGCHPCTDRPRETCAASRASASSSPDSRRAVPSPTPRR